MAAVSDTTRLLRTGPPHNHRRVPRRTPALSLPGLPRPAALLSSGDAPPAQVPNAPRSQSPSRGLDRGSIRGSGKLQESAAADRRALASSPQPATESRARRDRPQRFSIRVARLTSRRSRVRAAHRPFPEAPAQWAPRGTNAVPRCPTLEDDDGESSRTRSESGDRPVSRLRSSGGRRRGDERAVRALGARRCLPVAAQQRSRHPPEAGAVQDDLRRERCRGRGGLRTHRLGVASVGVVEDIRRPPWARRATRPSLGAPTDSWSETAVRVSGPLDARAAMSPSPGRRAVRP